MDSSVRVISGPEFASVFALRPHLFAWFLGAGASAASGIPTGYAMIRDFKTRIFCREVGYTRKEVDAADPLWIARIDDYFKTNSILPPEGDPTEYSAAFEAVYPTEKHRRQYIDDAIRLGTPSFGHRVLASLMSDGKLSVVFTTNFDPLVETSVTLTDQLLSADKRALPTLAAIDSAERASRCVAESDWPLIAKLHGDYTSTKIKNTNSELEHQDENMREVLVSACQRFALVVVGYSGRDTSVMEALESVLMNPQAYPSGLYWVCSSPSKLLPAVNQLLENAALAGVDVCIVESKNFDELAGDLVAQVELPDVLMEHVMQRKAPPRLQLVKPQTVDARKFPVLRYSSLLVQSVPTVARRIQLSNASTTVEIRALLKEKGCRAVVACLGRQLAVFGNDEQLLAALQSLEPRLDGTIQLDPEGESWALGLIYDALTRALARRRPLSPRLKRSGHGLVVMRNRPDEEQSLVRKREAELSRLKAAYEDPLTGKVPKLSFPYQEGVNLKLERVEGRWWCNFEPFTFVEVPLRKESSLDAAAGDALGLPQRGGGDPAGDWRRERWARKYNPQWSRIVDAWAALLTTAENGQVCALGLAANEGVDAQFSLSPVTGWSRPSHDHAYFERTK